MKNGNGAASAVEGANSLRLEGETSGWTPPTDAQLLAAKVARHGDLSQTGWLPRLHGEIGYFTPADYYEASLEKLIGPDTVWLDAGGGRSPCPHHDQLSQSLSNRCARLVVVDPSENVHENAFAHEAIQLPIEEYVADSTFDLITLRMVAEHLTDPEATLRTLARALKPGGLLLMLTVDRWSPVSLAAALVPFRFHHGLKSWLWQSEDRDTFPVAYRINTARRIAAVASQAGLTTERILPLDDCRVLIRYRWLHRLELLAWHAARSVRIPYPERCLLAVLRRP